jgi:hypothetical protein
MPDLRPLAHCVAVTNSWLVVDLHDGRRIAHPLAWYPRLLAGSPEARARWVLVGDGEGIHWPDLDEDVEVAALLLHPDDGCWAAGYGPAAARMARDRRLEAYAEAAQDPAFVSDMEQTDLAYDVTTNDGLDPVDDRPPPSST